MAVSAIVSSYSHWKGIGLYDVACGDIVQCPNYFQLTDSQSRQLGTLGINPELYGGMTVVLLFIQNISAWLVGFLLYRYGRRDPYCVIASLMLIVTGTMFSTDSYLLSQSANMSLFMMVNVMIGVFYPVLLFYLPEGRFVPSWMKWPALCTFAMGLSNLLFPSSPFLNFLHWNPLLKESIAFLMHVLIVLSQIYRYFHGATSQQKRQIQWFVVSMTVYIVAVLLEQTPYPQSGFLRLLIQILMYTGLLSLPISVGVMVLEARLRQSAIAFNRTLVYFVLTVVTVAVYGLLVGGMGLFLQFISNTLTSLIAIGLVSVLFHPLRERIHRQINLLVYGERDNPYQVLSGLSRRLESSLTNRSLLNAIVETVAHAFRVPYVSIEIRGETGNMTLADYGQLGEHSSQIPLTVQGETVGWLILGAQHFQDMFPPKQLSLLEDLIRQVSIAVQAVQLTEELHRSRERLVNAREEERRRLRRDLHDGLGSVIASMMLRTEEALQLHDRNPASSKQALLTMKQQMKEIIADIRRLVYALRPPTLDEFGLSFALEELAGHFKDQSLLVVLSLPEEEPKFHAAVEVAVFRIVQEGLTNALKHANAGRCYVSLVCKDGILRLSIRDDGIGLPEVVVPGIGIRSMKERAEELGGTCQLQSTAGEGTRITVQIPLEKGRWDGGSNGERTAAYSFGG